MGNDPVSFLTVHSKNSPVQFAGSKHNFAILS